VSRFLLQMTGVPGSGKSTLAKAIGRETGAIVLDKDIIKSRILDGDEMGLRGLPESVAAPLHHAIVFDLARAFLLQGHSTVIDGAAFFPIVRSKGRQLADETSAHYFLIECFVPDLATLQARIDTKVLLSSQRRIASVNGLDRPGTAALTELHLRLDTRRPFDEYLREALEYIRR